VFADSLSSLLVIRFLTGLGLGGAMPNAIALCAEYALNAVFRNRAKHAGAEDDGLNRR
jgi:hypothetical protein